MITILINGKEEVLENEISVNELLKKKNIRPEVVTIEVDGKIIKREEYEKIFLKNGAQLEVVFFMGGGDSMEDKKDRKIGKKIANSVLDLIFNTPIVRLNHVVGTDMAEIYAKLESYSPGGSVKDRIALNMIEDAEAKGEIRQGSVIVEPTSGNTGIGLALICAVKGYKCILTMPESMSLERIYILKSYGAEIILTPATEGMQGAIKKAEEIVKKTKNAFIPQQFKNLANPEVHKKTTAQEILTCMDGKFDAFVAGVGTGGTVTGVGEVLKKKYPEIKVIAAEPESSAVLSGKPAGPHKIQGIGAGFIPDVLNRKIIDRIITVKDKDAYKTAQRLAKEEGIFSGISSGAACFAALTVARELGKNKRVVVIFPDTGERYFSIQQYFEI
jgi:cysteine synthase A